MLKMMRYLFAFFKYFFSFDFWKDFKAGQEEAVVAHYDLVCDQMHDTFLDQMRRVVDEEDEFGLAD